MASHTHKVIAQESLSERRRRIWAENLNASLELHGWSPKRFHRELSAEVERFRSANRDYLREAAS